MEKFDLYDENRNKLNITINRGDKLPENTYRLVVHLIIFNSKGEMLIQQRHPNKKNWPSLWDISVGGCVTAGETSVEAMIRETIEEIGIDLSNEIKRPIFTFNFHEGFDDIYIVNKDIDLSSLILQENEVVDARWASIEEICEMMSNNQFIIYHKSFLQLLKDTRFSENIYIE